MKKIFTKFSDAINYMETEKWDFFTIRKGKAQYHFWTVGSVGCYYAYKCMESGHAGCKRQIEENTIIKVHTNSPSPITTD